MRRRLTSKVYESIKLIYFTAKSPEWWFFLTLSSSPQIYITLSTCVTKFIYTFCIFCPLFYLQEPSRDRSNEQHTSMWVPSKTSLKHTHCEHTLAFLIRGEEMSVYIILVKGTGQIEKKNWHSVK